jgi:hypothetical protein
MTRLEVLVVCMHKLDALDFLPNLLFFKISNFFNTWQLIIHSYC